MNQSCQALVDRPGVAELRFSRVGQHFVIFIGVWSTVIANSGDTLRN